MDNALKTITTPPNWVDEKYESILKENFKNIDYLFQNKYSENAVFKMQNSEIGKSISKSLFDKKKGAGLALYKNHDNVILNIHGSNNGEVLYQGYKFNVSEVIQRLEDTGLIPENTKQIYTMSCYGGLQNKGVTTGGIPFESLHTSKDKVAGLEHTDKRLEQLDNTISKRLNEYKETDIKFRNLTEQRLSTYQKLYEAAEKGDSALVKKYENELFIKDKIYNKSIDILDNLDEKIDHLKYVKEKIPEEQRIIKSQVSSGEITEKYKKNVIDFYEKYGKDFANAAPIAEDQELKNSLWYLIKDKEEIKNYFEENNPELYKILNEKYGKDYKAKANIIPESEPIADKQDVIKEQPVEPKSTIEEQPVEPKPTIEEQPVKTKPTIEEQPVKTKPTIEEPVVKKPSTEKTVIEKASVEPKPVSEPIIKEKIVSEPEVKQNIEQKTLPEQKHKIIQETKPEHKTEIKPTVNPEPDIKIEPNIKSNAKVEPKVKINSEMKTNKLSGSGKTVIAGLGLLAVAGITAGIIASKENKKKERKEEREQFKETQNNKNTEYYNNSEYYNNDLENAANISRFTKGHYAYSL